MEKKPYEVMFFPNGNTCVFKDGAQVAELQDSWFQVFIRFLKEKGIDPLEAEYTMADGRKAEPFLLDDGTYNWRVL